MLSRVISLSAIIASSAFFGATFTGDSRPRDTLAATRLPPAHAAVNATVGAEGVASRVAMSEELVRPVASETAETREPFRETAVAIDSDAIQDNPQTATIEEILALTERHELNNLKHLTRVSPWWYRMSRTCDVLGKLSKYIGKATIGIGLGFYTYSQTTFETMLLVSAACLTAEEAFAGAALYCGSRFKKCETEILERRNLALKKHHAIRVAARNPGTSNSEDGADVFRASQSPNGTVFPFATVED